MITIDDSDEDDEVLVVGDYDGAAAADYGEDCHSDAR